MLINEKGSALLTVMLMMLVFTILGVSIISVSIGGAKRTEIRESAIETDLDAIKNINEGIACIKALIDDKYDRNVDLKKYQDEIIDKVRDNCSAYTIKNVTSEYSQSVDNDGIGEIDISEDFTRVFDVSTEAYSGEYYTQRLYVTAMPSFLKYALGAENNLTLNGSVHVKNGDLYAGKNLYISNMARYILGTPKIVRTELSKTDENSHLEVYGDIFYCKEEGGPSGEVFEQQENSSYCYNNYGEIDYFDNGRNPLNWDDSMTKENYDPNILFEVNSESINKTPTLYLPNDDFVKVIIPETVIDKLSQYMLVPLNVDNIKNLDSSMFNFRVNEVHDTNDNGYLDTSNAIPDKTNYIEGNSSEWIYIEPNDENNSLFRINKGEWLIVDGNAYIENVRNDLLNIDANIIVTGDLRIKGNVNFNSTMYVLGDVDVIDANIKGYAKEDEKKKGELILLNDGKLRIGKINSFEDPEEGKFELRSYFYTASNAELYAVGSYIEITGGLFAGGKIEEEVLAQEGLTSGNLEVNSFRGKTTFNHTSIKFVPDNDYKLSRLTISNEKKLFINQAQGLPRVDKLDFIVDPIKKN